MEPDFVLDEIGEAATLAPPRVMRQPTAVTKPDMSWHEFVTAVHGIRDQRTKAVVLAIVVLSKGRKGEAVDFDAVAEGVGRSVTTLKNLRTRLWDAGWIEPKPALTTEGRPYRRWVTAKEIGG